MRKRGRREKKSVEGEEKGKMERKEEDEKGDERHKGKERVEKRKKEVEYIKNKRRK